MNRLQKADAGGRRKVSSLTISAGEGRGLEAGCPGGSGTVLDQTARIHYRINGGAWKETPWLMKDAWDQFRKNNPLRYAEISRMNLNGLGEEALFEWAGLIRTQVQEMLMSSRLIQTECREAGLKLEWTWTGEKEDDR